MSTVFYLIVIAVLAPFVFFIGLKLYQPDAIGGETALVKTLFGSTSEFRKHADRIKVIRAGGSGNDGIHMLSDPLKISEDDYLLMGCDNSTAARNFPALSMDQIAEGRWFAGGNDLKPEHAGYNNHQTQRKDGTWEIEAFYTTLPRKQYQASPEEVAWHYVRRKELIAQNIPIEQRKVMLKEEAKGKPWEAMQ